MSELPMAGGVSSGVGGGGKWRGGRAHCNNCGRYGHKFRDCSEPILSCGIVLLVRGHVLMVQRKNSIAYIDFLRGKYEVHDKLFLQRLWNEMTEVEHANILNRPFQEIWTEMWNGDVSRDRTQERDASFAKLREVNLRELCRHATAPPYATPEWGFPKGRKMPHETDLQCALREFFEETHLERDLAIRRDIEPFQEDFIGSNGKRYRHRYFVATLTGPSAPDLPAVAITSSEQRAEISDIAWVKLTDLPGGFVRPYQDYRLALMTRLQDDLAFIAGA